MDLDSLWPWRGPGLALALALIWAGGCRLLGRPDIGAVGAGLGIAAGWALVLGVVTASPRQILERLPMLAIGAAALGLVLAMLAGGGRRAGVAVAGVVLGVLAGAWWLAGMPLAPADLQRVAVPLGALAVLLGATALALTGPWLAVAAAGSLLAGQWIAAPPGGPWMLLGAGVLTGALGAAVAGDRWQAPARLAVALALGALAAAPVLGRGAAADWLAAAAPVAGLWLGPAMAAHLPGRFALPVGWLVAGGVPLVFCWLLSRAS